MAVLEDWLALFQAIQNLLCRLQMGVAYATVVNSSEPLAALRMVTHGWGNIFRSLEAVAYHSSEPTTGPT